MAQHTLVILTTVKQHLGDANISKYTLFDELRAKVCCEVSEFLTPYKGKGFQSFSTVREIWGQPLYHPFGVVLGATDPALFMFVAARALQRQNHILEHKLFEVIGDAGSKVMDGMVNGRNVSAFALSGADFQSNPWLNKYLDGQFLHDSGLYSIPHGKCGLDDGEQEKVMTNMKEYALCVLSITD